VHISDAAGEFLRLSQHYRDMSDPELRMLAQQKSQLTEIAQQVLAQEISRRGLNLAENIIVDNEPETSLDPAYDEDRQLILIATVWSRHDALQVQWLLDRAGIPFYLGEEKATGVDAVASPFEQGVSVQVVRAELPWVRDVMKVYEAKDAPADQKEGISEARMRCPKCHSDDVVFQRLVRDPDREEGLLKYRWTCDACDHQWTDDGFLEQKPAGF
jgi:DNA-directed RNA polymerase subunit M/transcription elongation factor TFIIS